MKRIFLSLPMSGRTDEEIQAQINEMKANFLMKNPFDKGEEIIFLDNLGYEPDYRDHCKIEALTYLGGAIDKMAYCDGVYFGNGWSKARGCKSEWDICVHYGITRFINVNDGSIGVMRKKAVLKGEPLNGWSICALRCNVKDCPICSKEERDNCGTYMVLKEREERR